jgi:PAB1-binding protein PBP1
MLTWWYAYDIPEPLWYDFSKGGTDAGTQYAMANPMGTFMVFASLTPSCKRLVTALVPMVG